MICLIACSSGATSWLHGQDVRASLSLSESFDVRNSSLSLLLLHSSSSLISRYSEDSIAIFYVEGIKRLTDNQPLNIT